MRQGRVEQFGTAEALYERPATAFVRDFIGTTLQLGGRLLRADNATGVIELTDGTLLEGRPAAAAAIAPGEAMIASIRPEAIAVVSADAVGSANTLAATILTVLFAGDRYEAALRIGGSEVHTVLPRRSDDALLTEGVRIGLRLPPDRVTLWRQ